LRSGEGREGLNFITEGEKRRERERANLVRCQDSFRNKWERRERKRERRRVKAERRKGEEASLIESGMEWEVRRDRREGERENNGREREKAGEKWRPSPVHCCKFVGRLTGQEGGGEVRAGGEEIKENRERGHFLFLAPAGVVGRKRREKERIGGRERSVVPKRVSLSLSPSSPSPFSLTHSLFFSLSVSGFSTN